MHQSVFRCIHFYIGVYLWIRISIHNYTQIRLYTFIDQTHRLHIHVNMTTQPFSKGATVHNLNVHSINLTLNHASVTGLKEALIYI